MKRSIVLQRKRGQKIRARNSVALRDDLERVGIIAPSGGVWDSWFDGEAATPDFMTARDQSVERVREGV